jgi:phosphoribosylaminoimidazolecarboxamide formyltransferase/IMP cyclohydrolase
MTSFFCECVIAPDFTDSALDVFRKKPNLRVVKAKFLAEPLSGGLHLRSVRGALLVQDEDGGQFETDRWNSVTVTKPSSAQLEDLQFAMRVAKHVKSNAVIFAKNGVTLAVGAGQMSRIDSANIAVAKAKEVGFSLEGAVLASDAFFPFRDTVDFAAGLKIAAIVQPGGSMRDQESIDAANEHGITMVFTGERHFRH